RLVAAAMLAAAVTHTFLDIIPSVLLDVPDDSMALAALPGHRMVLDGRGKEAVRISAVGSMLAVSFGLVIALPLTLMMTRLYPVLESYMGLVLAGVAVFLLVTEERGFDSESLRRRFVAAVVLFASGLLGYYALERGSVADPLIGEPSLLMPLFTGLFGLPLLAASAFENSEIPSQGDSEPRVSKRVVARSAFGGGIAGGFVGWIPGMSPAVATVIVQGVLPDSENEEVSMREFIVAVSGVNTSNAVFALLALYFIRRARSGVTVAVSRLGRVSPNELVLYLMVLTAVSVAAFGTTLYVGGRAFGFVRRIDYRRLTLVILILLVVLTLVFAGLPGLPVLFASSVVGLVPNYTRVRRVHCMGSLLLPLVLFYV
ncbi:MAG: tripartite tricarboxylate transporter permease, partial [Halobacteria archaeon]|nr:tripartite tricarboxylate transporter permease [Halobacteria archaeon]